MNMALQRWMWHTWVATISSQRVRSNMYSVSTKVKAKDGSYLDRPLVWIFIWNGRWFDFCKWKYFLLWFIHLIYFAKDLLYWLRTSCSSNQWRQLEVYCTVVNMQSLLLLSDEIFSFQFVAVLLHPKRTMFTYKVKYLCAFYCSNAHLLITNCDILYQVYVVILIILDSLDVLFTLF